MPREPASSGPTGRARRRLTAGAVGASLLAAALAPAVPAVAATPPVADVVDPPTSTTPAPPDAPVPPEAPTPPAPSPTRFDLAERLEEGPPLPPNVPVPYVIASQARGGYTAKVLQRTPVLDAPAGKRRIWTAGPTTPHTGNATRLLVRKARYDAEGRPWLGVGLPIRPNGLIGWVPADDVQIEHTPVYVRVRLAGRSVSVYRSGRLVVRVRSVIGARATPTPEGLFAVYETAKQRGPRDFLGPWALHLTALSEVLKDYGGGPGRAAIHGRGPESIRQAPLGAAASHGCVRISNPAILRLRALATPGTPVRITRR